MILDYSGRCVATRNEAKGSLAINTSTKKKIEAFPIYYEAKVTTAILTKKHRQHQLLGMVDALSENKETTGATFGYLNLILTQDSKLGVDLLEYAAKKDIIIYASILTYDFETKEFTVSDPINMNMFLEKYKGQKKIDLKEIFKNISPDTYKGVKVEDVKNKPTSDSNDPDPATYDDY